MRHGRAKAARKTLQYFHRTIGLKAPYAILLDATMVVAMFQQKILPFKERMDRVLQTTGSEGPNKYCILQSAFDELQTIHDKLQAKKHPKAEAFRQALDFIRNECIILDHKKEKENQRISKNEEDEKDDGDGEAADEASKEKRAPASVQEDLLHHIKNDEKPYVVGTQDENLLHTLRSKGTVPIVRLANSSVLILENPSKQSQTKAEGAEQKKWKNSLQDSERQLVNIVRKEKRAAQVTTSNNSGATYQRKKNKAKGPNPLSCKRKQGAGDKKESSSKKRRLRAKAKGS